MCSKLEKQRIKEYIIVIIIILIKTQITVHSTTSQHSTTWRSERKRVRVEIKRRALVPYSAESSVDCDSEC